MSVQDRVGVAEKVVVEVGVGLAEEVALVEEEEEGVMEGEGLELAVGVPDWVSWEDWEAEGQWEELTDTPELGDAVDKKVVAESPDASGASVPHQSDMVGSGVMVSSPAPEGTPETLAVRGALRVLIGDLEVVGETVPLGESLVEAEAEEEAVRVAEALVEGEAGGEAEALPLALGEAEVEMLPVAVPGGGGAAATKAGSPSSPPCAAAAYPAPRLVGELALVRMAGFEKREDFVPVRVEVWVWVVVPSTGRVTVG